MLQITCPYCGARNDTEFVFGGEDRIKRPSEPDTVPDAVWADYLFNRTNAKGIQYERWQHRYGCRQWLMIKRDTVTHEISFVDKLELSPEEIPFTTEKMVV